MSTRGFIQSVPMEPRSSSRWSPACGLYIYEPRQRHSAVSGFVVVVHRPFKRRNSAMAKPRGSGFDVVLRRRCSYHGEAT